MVAALTLVNVTLIFAFVPTQTFVAVALNTAPGPGLIVIVLDGVDVQTVAQGEFIERTITCLVVAEADVLKNVKLNVVVVVVAVKVFQVTPLSSEYSYVAPAIYGDQVAVNDTELPEQIVVAPEVDNVGTAVKFGLTNTDTTLLLADEQTPLVT